MEVNGQLQAPASLPPGKVALVSDRPDNIW